MNIRIWFLLLWFMPFAGYAQRILKGTVLENGTNSAIPDAVVTVYQQKTNRILTSARVRNGHFEVSTDNLPDTITLTVRALDILPQTQTVKSNSDHVSFIVNKKSVQLKEVIIKSPKIRQSGDTLNYNVSRFMDATDRSIGDVLKKLPNINVDESGQIYYQNKPISKFYIEGMDMLKGKYNLATNNIDASKVATVQVLENHQPLKVLKGTDIPNEAAINLKLKNSALGAFFATAQLGGGTQTYQPSSVLRSNELVGMRFTKRQQNMVVYKSDNTGRDITLELNDFYDGISRKKMPDYLSLQKIPSPAVDKQHYLFNNARIISLNDLRLLKKDLFLTSTISYLEDRQKSQSYAEQKILIPEQPAVHITEQQNQRLVNHTMNTKLVLEKNTEQDYISNKFGMTKAWQTDEGISVTNKQTRFQKLETPDFTVSNEFRWVKGKGRKKYQVGAWIEYANVRNSLSVTPSPFSVYRLDTTFLGQNVHVERLMSEVYFSGGKQWKNLYADYKLTLYSNMYKMHSFMEAGAMSVRLTEDSLLNHIRRGEYGGKVSSSFRYEFVSGLSLYFLLPLEYILVKRWNDRKVHGFVSLALSFNYQINPLIRISGGIGYSSSIGHFEEDYPGYIMTTYRSLNRNEGIQSRTHNLNSTLSLNYRNPYTTLFINTYLVYSGIWNNTLSEILYDGFVNHTKRIFSPNNGHNFRTSVSIGKNIRATTISLQIINMLADGISLNQGTRTHYINNTLDVGCHIASRLSRFLIGDYMTSFHLMNMRIENTDLRFNTIMTWSQQCKLSLLLCKSLMMTTSIQSYYNNRIASGSRFLWLGNTALQYKMGKVDFILDWNNIFNIKKFIMSSYNSTSCYYSESILRPSEITLRIRFKF